MRATGCRSLVTGEGTPETSKEPGGWGAAAPPPGSACITSLVSHRARITVQPFVGGARSGLDQGQHGAWVEGALTSGRGLGAICRPLTDWPLVEARLMRWSSLHSHAA